MAFGSWAWGPSNSGPSGWTERSAHWDGAPRAARSGPAEAGPALLTEAPCLPTVHVQHESQIPRHEPASPRLQRQRPLDRRAGRTPRANHPVVPRPALPLPPPPPPRGRPPGPPPPRRSLSSRQRPRPQHVPAPRPPPSQGCGRRALLRATWPALRPGDPRTPRPPALGALLPSAARRRRRLALLRSGSLLLPDGSPSLPRPEASGGAAFSPPPSSFLPQQHWTLHATGGRPVSRPAQAAPPVLAALWCQTPSLSPQTRQLVPVPRCTNHTHHL